MVIDRGLIIYIVSNDYEHTGRRLGQRLVVERPDPKATIADIVLTDDGRILKENGSVLRLASAVASIHATSRNAP